MTRQLMRKIDFAKLVNVDKSRISHYLADKKISAAALVGTGRTALIDVDRALADLRERLDVDGLVRTGLNTRLYPAPAKRAAPAAPVVDLSEEMGIFENAARRLARALVGAGWPTTEQGAWETLVRGLDELDDQREAVEAA
jgi:hypothetical protein